MCTITLYGVTDPVGSFEARFTWFSIMKRIDTENAAVDMVLAKDVVQASGACLLPSGTKLTERLCAVLQAHNVESVQIHDENDKLESEAPNPPVTAASIAPEPETITPVSEDSQPEPSPVAPLIEIAVAGDAMSASIIVSSQGSPEAIITEDAIATELSRGAITFGLVENVVSEVVEKWNRTRTKVCREKAACGIPPTPGKPDTLEISAKHIATVKELKSVQKAQFCWEIADCVRRIGYVRHGAMIGRCRKGTPGAAGTDVRGTTVSPGEPPAPALKLDPSITVSPNGDTLIAATSGLLSCVDGSATIVQVSPDSTIDIVIANDKLSAALIVHPAFANGHVPELEEILDLIGKKGIVRGVNHQLLKKICHECSKGKYRTEATTFAQGTPPADGIDGSVEFLFETQTVFRPPSDAKDSIDYKNVSLIQSASKEQVLARLRPAQPGTTGKDVLGAIIPCRDGTPAQLPAGTNTQVSASNPSELVAATEGIVRINSRQLVEVSECYTVEGDVDFHTGNITYDKSVSIKGDVKAGFNVTCGGDLDVYGTIEDSQISVGGNVLCRMGFVGHQHGTIDAKGDVSVGFIYNQTIRANGSVVVAKEAISSRIRSHADIHLDGQSHSAVGGSLIARNSITAHTVGSENGVRTELTVGVDYEAEERLAEISHELQQTQENLLKVKTAITVLERKKGVHHSYDSKTQALHDRLENALKQYETMEVRFHKAHDHWLKARTVLDTAFVAVTNTTMPGTSITIGVRRFQVTTTMEGPSRFHVSDNEIIPG